MNSRKVDTLPAWLTGLLRVPLFYKIVVANGTLLALLGILALVLPPLTGSDDGWLLPAWGAGVVLMIVLNGAVVHLALLPLRGVEETARRIEAGDTAARVPLSPLADGRFARFIHFVNEMLDSVEAAKVRHERLSTQLARVEEAERKRIAQALFDDIAQVLSAALLQLQLAQHRLEAETGETARAPLEAARSGILDAVAGIQRIGRGLRPPELDELGPLAALEVHSRQITEETGVPVRIAGSLSGVHLNSESALALYRIIQEGMATAVLHGIPSRLDVAVKVEDDHIQAVLKDDGGGLRAQGHRNDPAGLLRMHERARQAGGELTVRSAPDAATRLVLTLPRRPDIDEGERSDSRHRSGAVGGQL